MHKIQVSYITIIKYNTNINVCLYVYFTNTQKII